MSRAPLRRLLPLIPPALLVALYWPGLEVWFHTDDFSLLQLVRLPAHEFWPGLAEPRAQGTFRWLSERIYFRLFFDLFGLNAFPYRALAFLTEAANLLLLYRLARRLSGSAATATLAASAWALHHGLAVTMSWSSAYNQALHALFVLVLLDLFVTFAETGRRRWYCLEAALFPLGFAALEAIVAYPALALAYCLLFRRERWRWTLPLFAVSAALAWLQLSAASARASGAYSLSTAPAELAASLGFYIELALAAKRPAWLGLALAACLAAAAAFEAGRGRRLAAFGCLWFLIELAPYLPLTAHRSDYYLFLPAAGLALAAAATVASAWRRGGAARWAAAAALAVWLSGTIPYARGVAEFNRRLSVGARNLLTGVSHARARHPNKTILLADLDEELFYASVYHGMFPMAGLYDVFLAPDRAAIDQRSGYAEVEDFVLSPEETLLGIRRDSLVVYDAGGPRLQEITSRYGTYAPFRLQAGP